MILLYSELAKPLTRYAMNYTRQIHLAEDIVSETFLRATRHCIANSELPARAWFYKVTRNIALDFVRRKEKLQYGDIPETVDFSREANPEALAEHTEQVETLAASLSRVPEPYKSVLVLKEYDHLTYAEIANIMGVSIDNVKVMLFRGRQKLKELYRRGYKDEV